MVLVTARRRAGRPGAPGRPSLPAFHVLVARLWSFSATPAEHPKSRCAPAPGSLAGSVAFRKSERSGDVPEASPHACEPPLKGSLEEPYEERAWPGRPAVPALWKLPHESRRLHYRDRSRAGAFAPVVLLWPVASDP